jgi:hypothetical protein
MHGIAFGWWFLYLLGYAAAVVAQRRQELWQCISNSAAADNTQT